MFEFFYSVPWADDPSPLVSSLQSMVEPSKIQKRVSLNSSPTSQSVEERLGNLKSPVGKWPKRILKFLLPRLHNLVALRERAKSMLILR